MTARALSYDVEKNLQFTDEPRTTHGRIAWALHQCMVCVRSAAIYLCRSDAVDCREPAYCVPYSMDVHRRSTCNATCGCLLTLSVIPTFASLRTSEEVRDEEDGSEEEYTGYRTWRLSLYLDIDRVLLT